MIPLLMLSIRSLSTSMSHNHNHIYGHCSKINLEPKKKKGKKEDATFLLLVLFFIFIRFSPNNLNLTHPGNTGLNETCRLLLLALRVRHPPGARIVENNLGTQKRVKIERGKKKGRALLLKRLVRRKLAEYIRAGVPIPLFSGLPIETNVLVGVAPFLLGKPTRLPTTLLHLPSLCFNKK